MKKVCVALLGVPWNFATQTSLLDFLDHAPLVLWKQSVGALTNEHFSQLQWSSQKQVLGHPGSSQPTVPSGHPSDGRGNTPGMTFIRIIFKLKWLPYPSCWCMQWRGCNTLKNLIFTFKLFTSFLPQSIFIMLFSFHLWRSLSRIIQLPEEHFSGHVALHTSSKNKGSGFNGPFDTYKFKCLICAE